jgi:hypothetical protein
MGAHGWTLHREGRALAPVHELHEARHHLLIGRVGHPRCGEDGSKLLCGTIREHLENAEKALHERRDP